MAWLERRLLVLVCLSVAVALLSLPSGGSAAGPQQPSGAVNFTIGVIGAVWCKNCRYAGYVRSKNVSPLPNAAALLRCRRGGRALSVWGATDASGYFKIQAAELAAELAAVPFASKDCAVYVPRSPRGHACGVAIQPRRNKGSPLKFQQYVELSDGLQALYTAGNFVFGPQDPAKC